MSTMKAVRIHAYGGPDVLAYEDAPRPTAGDGEVLIRVHATSVNPFDCAVRAGYMNGYFQYTLPLILGTDVSGVVEAVGPGVTNVSAGDVVYTPGRCVSRWGECRICRGLCRRRGGQTAVARSSSRRGPAARHAHGVAGAHRDGPAQRRADGAHPWRGRRSRSHRRAAGPLARRKSDRHGFDQSGFAAAN